MLDASISLVVATLLLVGSPGPVPLALAASGAVFGWRPSLPFLAGILLGLLIVITLSATGLAALLQAAPSLRLAMQIAGAIYIGWLAWKVATAPIARRGSGAASRPHRFHDGLILNLLNPKAYAVFIALFSQFLLPLEPRALSVAVTAGVVYLLGVLIDFFWLALGGVIQPLFDAPRAGRVMRVMFALLMVAAVLYAFTKA